MEFILFLIILVIFIAAPGIRIINQYERGVVLTLGKFSGV